MSKKRKRVTRKRWTQKEQRRAWEKRNPRKKRVVIWTGEENPIRVLLDPKAVRNCYGGPCFDLDEKSARSLKVALQKLLTGGIAEEW